MLAATALHVAPRVALPYRGTVHTCARTSAALSATGRSMLRASRGPTRTTRGATRLAAFESTTNTPNTRTVQRGHASSTAYNPMFDLSGNQSKCEAMFCCDLLGSFMRFSVVPPRRCTHSGRPTSTCGCLCSRHPRPRCSHNSRKRGGTAATLS